MTERHAESRAPMNTEELKRRLGEILAKEEEPVVEWDAIEAMSTELASDLGHALPPIAADYLLSVERRREDSVFGHAQRSVVVLYLNHGRRTPRKNARVELTADVTLRRAGRANHRVRVFDASPDGCKIELIDRIALGDQIYVKFEGMDMLEGVICWVKGFTAGVEFRRSIHPAVFDNLADKSR
ncbi:MAG: PilZ domain-containing protein [Sphingomicrobium sp.]